MRVRGRQAPPHSHTWLPYITPNGVRLAREVQILESLWIIYGKYKRLFAMSYNKSENTIFH